MLGGPKKNFRIRPKMPVSRFAKTPTFRRPGEGFKIVFLDLVLNDQMCQETYFSQIGGVMQSKMFPSMAICPTKNEGGEG